ncbi:PREDICTED: dynactin subunit 2-like [Priapulus caudatus]|uniref:Dynactin subunit 2-like n=1 Tax=Priapulus caudatus TaxID=37621 RepID=A0ABM1DNN1_PRICU|nr:PREDICTED: dynactin subunit 2-like [Priapulus caudatus]
MADPKYAGLPGIAVGEPDVYETGDLPEDDQHRQAAGAADDSSESVERIDIKAGDAFSKFKGKSVDGAGVDFSETAAAARPNRGYYADKAEYELSGGELRRERETPAQKHQRLQLEMRELADEVRQAEEAVRGDGGDKSSPVLVAKQVEYLQRQLADLQLETVLGSQAVVDSSDPQGALQRKLISQIEAFKAATTKTAAAAAAPPSEDHIIYELYYKPEQARFSQAAKVADLEARLERLEASIGGAPDTLSALCQEAEGRSLVEVSRVLAGKLALLEPANLDQVEGRLQAMNQKLKQIADKRSVVEDADAVNRVAALYELMMRWEQTTACLPAVVERMSALKDLHEQALQFSQALSYLDSVQQQLASSLHANEAQLKTVSGTFSDNMAAIRSNCESLDSRLKVLNK